MNDFGIGLASACCVPFVAHCFFLLGSHFWYRWVLRNCGCFLFQRHAIGDRVMNFLVVPLLLWVVLGSDCAFLFGLICCASSVSVSHECLHCASYSAFFVFVGVSWGLDVKYWLQL